MLPFGHSDIGGSIAQFGHQKLNCAAHAAELRDRTEPANLQLTWRFRLLAVRRDQGIDQFVQYRNYAR